MAAGASSSAPSCTTPYNTFIVDGLLEIVDSKKEKFDQDANIKRVYSKAIQSIAKAPMPLLSITDIRKLSFVGPVIAKEIEKICKAHGVILQAAPSSSFAATKVPPKPKQARKPKKVPEEGEKSAATRNYVPQFESGAFAILVAMSRDDHVFGKKELQMAAQPYSRDSFTVVEVDAGKAGFYNAWSSATVLIKKGFMKKWSSPAKYELTDAGRELGAFLSDEYDRLKSTSSLGVDIMRSHANAPPPAEKSSAASSAKVLHPRPEESSLQHGMMPAAKRTRLHASIYDIVLLIDTAEQVKHHYVEDCNAIVAGLAVHDIKAETKPLSIGDYCWVAKPQGEVGFDNAMVLFPVIERKKGSDFASSIKDGRYLEQKIRLKRSGLPIIYLIEGDMNVDKTLDPKSMPSALAKMASHDNFFVYKTSDIENTIRLLGYIHASVQRRIMAEGLPDNAEPYPAWNARLSKNSEDAGNTFGSLLVALDGVSVQKAEAIIKRYPTLQSLLVAYASCTSVQEESELLASMTFMAKGLTPTKLGNAVSMRIRNFFRDKEYASSFRGGAAD